MEGELGLDSDKIPCTDLRIDIYSEGCFNPSIWVRLTHLPTGKTVTAGPGRSQIKLKDEALKVLQECLEER